MNLLILNYEYPPLGGGAGVCSQFHAEGLSRKGHQVSVLTTWFEGEKEYEKKNNLEIIRLKSKRKNKYRSNPIEMLSWAYKAFIYIEKNQLYSDVDLVLAHFSIPGGLVATLLKLRRKIPYIIISHGQDIPWFNLRELFIYHVLFYFPIQFICRRSKFVTVLSERRKKDAIKLMGNKFVSKIKLIPNGCDTDFFKPSVVNRNENILQILFSCRLTHQKDPFTMLKAILMLKSSLSFQLVIIGDGPLRRKMENFVKDNNLNKKVKFYGWLSKTELVNFYQQSHLMIASSKDEGMSLGFLEALACGLYVITTPVSGSDEYLVKGINGDFLSFGDSIQLAEKIEEFHHLKFKQKYNIPEDTLGKVRHEIGWEKITDEYNNLISQ
jgi:glycosyltransferase involved in cell wall biosynthesis